MKSKVNQKLTLNKKTIARVGMEELNSVKGGTDMCGPTSEDTMCNTAGSWCCQGVFTVECTTPIVC